MTPRQLLPYARGDRPADLLLKNAQVVNVLSGEVVPSNVAIVAGRIVGLGEYQAKREIDLAGAYLAPGLIDAHVHIESSLVPPREFARAVVPLGTTTVITDPHEIANVVGLDGIRFMLDDAKDGPLSMYVMASSCVPATAMETSGATLERSDLEMLRNNPWVIGLAEVMNFPGVVSGDSNVHDKIQAFADAVIDGHCPGLSGKDLGAYVVAGCQSDHECTSVEEALEKLRLGMTIFLREATNARNLKTLLPLVTPANHHRICLCTDDRQPADLLDEGHIDFMVRTSIAEGTDPLMALRMATWNTASYFRLADRGAITPGRRADLFTFTDLAAPRADLVFRDGHLVARGGEMAVPRSLRPPHPLPSTVSIKWHDLDFSIPARGSSARVIGVIPDQLVTRSLTAEISNRDGLAVTDPGRDLLKLAVVERHHASGAMGKGFVKGIGLQRGALASSIAHDHHNLIVVGADDRSMLAAVRRIAALGGGMVAAVNDKIVAETALPYAGLMSDRPIEEVRTALDKTLAAAHELGATLHDPFMALSFLGLEVIPSLKLTDMGLVDVHRFEIVPLWLD